MELFESEKITNIEVEIIILWTRPFEMKQTDDVLLSRDGAPLSSILRSKNISTEKESLNEVICSTKSNVEESLLADS